MRCRPGSGSASTTRRWRPPPAYRDIFGPENFFVELMGHDLPIEQRCRDGLRRIASELSLPYVVTNDSHYVTPGDAQAHEVLLCVQTGTNMADPKRFKFEGNAYYIKSAAEMRAISDDPDWQAGCDNTLLIAERSNVAFSKANLMPDFPLPDGETELSWFRKEVWAGMDRRFPGGFDDERRSGPSTRWASSSRWGSAATSWWSPTSSCGPSGTGSGSVRAAARRPARSCRTRWASPTSTRSRSG